MEHESFKGLSREGVDLESSRIHIQSFPEEVWAAGRAVKCAESKECSYYTALTPFAKKSKIAGDGKCVEGA